MKFTNVKQLIIKFMGGGIINFPTRFLRWVKINGDTDDSDDGGEGSDNEGTGLTGNVLNDWVTAVTQGEYTKYEDIPEADDTGVLTGWRRPTTKYNVSFPGSPTCITNIGFSDNSYTIVKDGSFYDTDIQT